MIVKRNPTSSQVAANARIQVWRDVLELEVKAGDNTFIIERGIGDTITIRFVKPPRGELVFDRLDEDLILVKFT